MVNKKQIMEFVQKQGLAVLSTANKSGKVESAVMGITLIDNVIFMSTDSDSRKVANILENNQASLLVGGLQCPSIQIDGEIKVVEENKQEEVKQKVMAVFPGVVGYLNPKSIFIEFRPKWARWSDYDQSPAEFYETNL